MANIIIETGPATGELRELPDDGRFTIGRTRSSTISLRDTLVSRDHCFIERHDGEWRLVDCGSSNGTFVNEAAVERVTLRAGDLIRVGETLFSFQEEADDPYLGRVIAGYRIDRRIGRGSGAIVYRGLQLSLNRVVAVKLLAPSLRENERVVRRFLREGRAAAKLDHLHIVQTFDTGRFEDDYYLVMEYVAGGSLKEEIDRNGSVPIERAFGYMLQALEALKFAERKRIVHRDVKPANLLLDAEGRLKLADLGIAADLRRRVGSTGSRVGSPRYVAPEQAIDGVVDHRADQYALASSVYHMISGEYPFAGGSVEEILAAKQQAPPLPLHERVPTVSPALGRVLQRMMERDPERRYPSAAEARQAWLEAGDAPVDPSTSEPRRLGWWALAAALAALGAGVGWLMFSK